MAIQGLLISPACFLSRTTHDNSISMWAVIPSASELVWRLRLLSGSFLKRASFIGEPSSRDNSARGVPPLWNFPLDYHEHGECTLQAPSSHDVE